MKRIYILLSFSIFCLAAHPILAEPSPSAPPAEAAALEAAKVAKEDWSKLTKKELRAKRKQVKSELKQAIKDAKEKGADTETLLLIIIAILLPPLAMLLYEGGITTRFWISLLLWLLFYIPGLIYTLIIILGEK